MIALGFLISVRINYRICHVLKIDTKYFDNADSLESTQAKICEYFYRTGEVWKRINNVINTQSKEKNDQLEKDYGIRVVFSDKD